jgi:hypothetical protein
MNSILQAFLDAMVNDDGSGTTGDLMDKTWWTDFVERIDTVISLAGLSIEEDQTFYVATTGSDTTGDGSLALPWATIDHAVEVLRAYRIAPGSTCTLQVDDGEYVITAPIANLPEHLIISGKNNMIRSVTSVQSSSGSSGNYEIVLNLLDVSSIEEGDECAITSASGGTNPLALQGTFEVTDVDAINSRITIHSPTTVLPSGLVTATARIYKTRIAASGCSGVTANTDVTLQHLAIIGDDTADMSGVAPDGAATTLTNVAIRNFAVNGVLAERGAQINADILTICACYNGVNAQTAGTVNADDLVITHVTKYALYCEYSAAIIAPGALIYKCDIGILCQHSGVVKAPEVVIENFTTFGVHAIINGTVSILEASLSSSAVSAQGIACLYHATVFTQVATIICPLPVYADYNAFVNAELGVLTGTSGGVYASYYSFVNALGSVITGALSPAKNTQGNNYAYIAAT